MKFTHSIFLLAMLALLSCGKFSDDLRPSLPDAAGVYVSNAGSSGNSNASISFIDYETDLITNNIYSGRNNFGVGDVLQSMSILNNFVYMVVNGSGKIEIATASGFDAIDAIVDLTSPRYLIPINLTQAYVTDQSSKVYKLDLEARQVLAEIPFPGWSEEMVLISDRVFVSSPSIPGQRPSDQVYVISLITDEVLDSIEVGFDPYNLALDNNGRLWVLCNGDAANNIPGGLYQCDPFTFQVTKILRFADNNVSQNPKMRTDRGGNRLYFLKEDLYTISIDDDQIAAPLVRANGRNFHGLGVDPSSGDIYVSDAKDFQQPGTVYRYSPDGAETGSFVAGIAPNGFNFAFE